MEDSLSGEQELGRDEEEKNQSQVLLPFSKGKTGWKLAPPEPHFPAGKRGCKDDGITAVGGEGQAGRNLMFYFVCLFFEGLSL